MGTVRTKLLLGAAIGGITMLGAPVAAEEATVKLAQQSAAQAAPVEERQSYALRLMMQVYNGEEDISHTQLLGVGRARVGNRSLTQFDYGDGAVVIAPDEGPLAAGRFLNVSATERAVVFNYDDKTMQGDPEISAFHNEFVRPWLNRGPATGRDVSWSQTVPLSALGVSEIAGGSVQIELSRSYFEHNGLPMVLIYYAVPAFSFSAEDGAMGVHWGEGIALTDPGFGMIYLNSALHRSVLRGSGGAQTPFRYARTMVAANQDGTAMIDYREVAQLKPYLEAFFSPEAMRVVPSLKKLETPSQSPLAIARNLDILAASIGENGANEVPATAAAQSSEDRGAEVMSSTSTAIGAITNTATYTGILDAAAADETEVLLTVLKRADTLKSEIQWQVGQMQSKANEILRLQDEIEASKTTWKLTDEAQAAKDWLANQARRLEAAEETFNARYDWRSWNGVPNEPQILEAAHRNYNQVKTDYEYALAGWETYVNDPDSYEPVIGAADEAKVAQLQKASDELVEMNRTLSQTTNESAYVIAEIKNAEPGVLAQALETAGPALQLLGDAVNGYSFGGALANFQNQAGSNMASGGQPKLSRSYSYTLSVDQSRYTFGGLTDPNLALDIFAVFGAAASGDPAAALGTALAVGTSSVTDILISAKGLADINRLNTDIAKEGTRLAREQKEQYIRRSDALQRQYDDAIAELDRQIAALDDYSDEAKEALRERMRERGLEVPESRDPEPPEAGDGSVIGPVEAEISGPAMDTENAPVMRPDFTKEDPRDEFQRTSDELDTDIEGLDAYADEADQALEDRMAERGLKPHQVDDPNWTDARIDPDTGMPTPGYWAYLKENYPGTLASYGIDPDAPVGHVGEWPVPAGPTQEEMMAGLADEIDKPTYPTAPMRDPQAPKAPREPEPSLADQGYVTETEQERWLRLTREENAEAAEELRRYQEEQLANREDETIFDGDYEMRVTRLETSELVVSAFDIDPVTFTGPTWDMPVFDEDEDLFVKNPDGTTSLKKVGPDDFEITPFDPPEISRFDPTDPDDLDGYPGTGEYPAFEYDGLSGTVETDLSKWEDWLATQDIRKLTQLALAAGYPNLASALADAENIIRQSQDAGYRAWANQAPSCSGYVGCGPSYLGRWTMKRSIVALGDILAQSREVFSTGGFSDIGISGFNLAYILRDFGIQDGDLIDVEIQQFGRTIANLEGHFLTTAGDAFSARLRPGVATMVVTALNEGSASPNTAEVTIEEVVRGDAVQTYDLNTGQTAVLRIEANATAE